MSSPDELREAADRVEQSCDLLTMTDEETADQRALVESARRLAAVIELHKPRDADAVTGDCAEESCEHEDVCPTQVFRVCIDCWNVAEASDPYFGERGIAPVLWPCDTARIARGETNERESNA